MGGGCEEESHESGHGGRLACPGRRGPIRLRRDGRHRVGERDGLSDSRAPGASRAGAGSLGRSCAPPDGGETSEEVLLDHARGARSAEGRHRATPSAYRGRTSRARGGGGEAASSGPVATGRALRGARGVVDRAPPPACRLPPGVGRRALESFRPGLRRGGGLPIGSSVAGRLPACPLAPLCRGQARDPSGGGEAVPALAGAQSVLLDRERTHGGSRHRSVDGRVCGRRRCPSEPASLSGR